MQPLILTKSTENLSIDPSSVSCQVDPTAGNKAVPYPAVKSGDVRRSLSVSYLIAINSAVAGLEIAVCVAFSFIPTLLLKSGYSETQMSIVLGVAPFIALFTVPGMGRWSDNCTNRLGRRRPFICGMSVILVFSLVLLYLGQAVDEDLRAVKVSALAVGVILLDYSSQAAINPCEALVSDLCAETNGEEIGFTVYSGMLSVGACLGYLLIALDWEALGISLGNKEQTAFGLCLILYSICFIITMISAKEKPFNPNSDPDLVGVNCEVGSDPGYESDVDTTPDSPSSRLLKPSKEKAVPLLQVSTRNRCSSFMGMRWLLPRRLVKSIFLLIKNMLYLPLSYYQKVNSTPEVLRNLYMADLFSWFGVMAYVMFYNDYCAVVVYGGKPDAPTGSMYDLLFDEGVRMGSWGLLLHSITAAIYAVFIQERVTKALGLKGSYKFGLAVLSLSMAATVIFSSSLVYLNIAAAASGVGYSVVTTIPNTLVTMYHENTMLYYGSNSWGGVGEAIAILDSGFYLSQICLSLVMGHIVEISGLPHYYIIVACLSGIVAIILSDKVVFTAKDLQKS